MIGRGVHKAQERHATLLPQNLPELQETNVRDSEVKPRLRYAGLFECTLTSLSVGTLALSGAVSIQLRRSFLPRGNASTHDVSGWANAHKSGCQLYILWFTIWQLPAA